MAAIVATNARPTQISPGQEPNAIATSQSPGGLNMFDMPRRLTVSQQ
jgi:hypothetical protein